MLHKLNGPRVIVALDFASAKEALDLVARLSADDCRLKVGKELFTRSGPVLVKQLVERGFDVFLDMKFHDIPNTVAAACRAAAELGVWMLNVHCSGGRTMMQAAREALAGYASPPLLIGVTVLTSLDASDLAELGYVRSPQAQVQHFADLARQAGLDGVVCSAHEASSLKQRCGDDFVLVTPGIRPAQATRGDQKRVMTPADAIRAGSHYLVIGRPITQASDPQSVLQVINQEIEGLT